MGVNSTGFACCKICGAEYRLFTIFNRDMQGLCKVWKRRHEQACAQRTPKARRQWARKYVGLSTNESSLTVDLTHPGFSDERAKTAAPQRPVRPDAEPWSNQMPKNYMTVVIQLPDDPQQRETIARTLPLAGTFHGGQITALSLEDEITVNELLEELLDSDDVDDARRRARASIGGTEATG